MDRIFRYLLLMTPGLAAGAAAFLLLLRRRRRALAASGLRSGPLREGAVCLFWMYCGGMAAITLVPNPGWLLSALRGKVTPYFNLGGLSHRVSLIPFSQPDGLFNLVGNIVMFLPFGFFAALLWRGFTGKRALGLGLGITCFIECWQILVGRCFDVDDIVFNTLGVWGGYLLWRLAVKTAPRLIRRFYVVEILELIAPAKEHEEQVMSLRAELLAEGGGFDGCAGLNEVETYGEWLDFRGREERKGWSPSHTWLSVRRSDGALVGIVNYRSPLTDFLLQYGGHIGYTIRPGQRRRGYAKETLRLTLEKCREAGEKRVLVTCDRENLASERTILANGGVLENEVEDKPGLGKSGVIRRYWITIE